MLASTCEKPILYVGAVAAMSQGVEALRTFCKTDAKSPLFRLLKGLVVLMHLMPPFRYVGYVRAKKLLIMPFNVVIY